MKKNSTNKHPPYAVGTLILGIILIRMTLLPLLVLLRMEVLITNRFAKFSKAWEKNHYKLKRLLSTVRISLSDHNSIN